MLIEPIVHGDDRGFFLESYRADCFERNGISARFVQEGHSKSVKGTLRGLHFQYPKSQAKLIRVSLGEALDVVLDIRVGSPSFGKWISLVLSADNHRELFIPEGFAHGFFVMSAAAEFQYKCTDYYAPEYERGIVWNDPQLAINWPTERPLLSARDRVFRSLSEIPREELPRYRSQEK